MRENLSSHRCSIPRNCDREGAGTT
jgi:hypothetical protein